MGRQTCFENPEAGREATLRRSAPSFCQEQTTVKSQQCRFSSIQPSQPKHSYLVVHRHSLIFEEMADLAAITEAVTGTLEESRIEAARALIVDQEREQHYSVLSAFRPQARNSPNQDPRSHVQDGKYAVFFDNVSTFLGSSLRTILDQRLILVS